MRCHLSSAPSDLNMALPPLVWQSYDIFLSPAVFKDGEKVKGTELTVVHNGVPVHYRTLVVAKTGAAAPKAPIHCHCYCKITAIQSSIATFGTCPLARCLWLKK